MLGGKKRERKTFKLLPAFYRTPCSLVNVTRAPSIGVMKNEKDESRNNTERNPFMF